MPIPELLLVQQEVERIVSRRKQAMDAERARARSARR